LCSNHGPGCLHFGYGFKPSGSNLYILRSYPLEWLDFSLWIILVKSHAKIPQKVCQSAGFGPSGPNSVRFGSTLDMLFLKSNKHQNLWNSLVIMVMTWLWPMFHKIKRSVGGENHRYRPPTHPHSQTLLTPSNKVEKERSLVS
jgi:hypothetical protein